MNARIKSYKPEYAIKDVPKAKTFGLWLPVTDRNLEKKIKHAFDLAKSAGQELTLTFRAGAA